MTREEAIRILDPETTKEELAGIKGYAAMMKVVDEACILAVAALREQEQRRWIPVTDRLPEDDHDVLIVGSGSPVKNVRLENSLEIARFSKDEGWILECWPDWETPIVTHWMPLPQPPKEE